MRQGEQRVILGDVGCNLQLGDRRQREMNNTRTTLKIYPKEFPDPQILSL